MVIFGPGNDTYDASGGATTDWVVGGDGDDALIGGSSADLFLGGAGRDILRGGGGTDWSSYADAVSAVQVSLALTTFQDTLGAGEDRLSGIENLQGSAFDDSLAGNGAANLILGGSGNDLLEGAASNDTLRGGAEADRLLGGTGSDSLAAGSGNDWLHGGAGNDTLTGGTGVDAFVFEDALSAPGNIDSITDFLPGTDRIVLDEDIFPAFDSVVSGTLAAAQFVTGEGMHAARDADDRIVYDTASGTLYYDADGSGGVAALKFAVLGSTTHPTLTAGDFLLVD